MQQTQYDVAIVGAGFSGPILAAKIAEAGVHPQTGDRLKIALIDAGPYFGNLGSQNEFTHSYFSPHSALN